MSVKDYGYDPGKLGEYTEELIKLLRLKATPTAIKLYKKKEDMLMVPKIRTPKEGEILTACQMLGQATRLNFTVGFTVSSLPGVQCAGICGLAQKETHLNSTHLTGVWFETDEDSLHHQNTMFCLEENYEAIAATPLGSGRVGDPDVCLVYGTPQQIMFLCCGYQYEDYEMMESSFVSETSCTDSWVRAIVTQKPCFTIPCFGERRFGGVLEEELVFAFPPRFITKILAGIRKLSKNGLRYPASYYGIQQDVRAGLSVSYK